MGLFISFDASHRPPLSNEYPDKPMKTTPKLHRLAWCVAGCLLTGCTISHRMPPTLSETVRAGLGTIAVESVGGATQPEFAKPRTKGEAAAAGAMQFAMEGIKGGEEVGVLLMPLSAAIGAMIGASKGVPAAEVEASERSLMVAFNQMDFQRAVRDQFVRQGRKETRHAFVAGNGSAGSAALLQVNVLGAGLAGSSEREALLGMFLRVHVRLLAPGNRAVLYDQEWKHTSGAHTFKEWAANGGSLYRRHLSTASSSVAKLLIEEIFLSNR